jgi:hypothetical protein
MADMSRCADIVHLLQRCHSPPYPPQTFSLLGLRCKSNTTDNCISRYFNALPSCQIVQPRLRTARSFLIRWTCICATALPRWLGHECFVRWPQPTNHARSHSFRLTLTHDALSHTHTHTHTLTTQLHCPTQLSQLVTSLPHHTTAHHTTPRMSHHTSHHLASCRITPRRIASHRFNLNPTLITRLDGVFVEQETDGRRRCG